MPVASMIELLEAGVHFGHQTQRWNPKMKPYIYGARNGIYVIDLRKTSDLLDAAYDVVREYAAKGKNVLFVGTKKQASEVNKLKEYESFIESGQIEKLPKKEQAQINKQIAKLSKTLGGIKEMRGLPDILFIVDQQKEDIAILEAKKLGVPVICLADTNADPDNIDYIIPGNDDAIRSVQLIASKLADAVLEGKELRANKAVNTSKVEEIKAEDAGVTEEVKA